MKKVVYQKNLDHGNRTKSLSFSSRTEDEESVTQVRKSFLYKLTPVESQEDVANQPQIHIRKEINTPKRIEKFNFQVKGHFYLNYKRFLVKVDFIHTLDIKINWRSKYFSPKKSAVLTK